MIVIVRHLEPHSGSHIDIFGNLDDFRVCFRKILPCVFRKSAGAEAELENIFGFRTKEKKRKHVLLVFQRQAVGTVNSHTALNPFGSEMKIAEPSEFGEIYRCSFSFSHDKP